ncbi:myosin-4-like [Ylistrum balloti]|uniref:myosin-4-like n=1 Tax=Ylistrum balloti TaxID=509963 RepID=UPI0029057E3B|nr:myosin-4-like [Ylistrum balloti]
MGTCSSGRVREPPESELTDILVTISNIVQPEVFSSLIDLLKHHEIISDSWKRRTAKASSPRVRYVSNVEHWYKVNKDNERHGSKRSPTGHQQQKNNRDDEKGRLQNEEQTSRIQLQEMALVPSTLDLPEDDHLKHPKKIMEEKSSQLQSTGITEERLRHEQQSASSYNSLIESRTDCLRNEMFVKIMCSRSIQTENCYRLKPKSVQTLTLEERGKENVQTQTSESTAEESAQVQTSDVRKRENKQNVSESFKNTMSGITECDRKGNCLLSKTFEETDKLQSSNHKYVQRKVEKHVKRDPRKKRNRCTKDKLDQSILHGTEEQATFREMEMAQISSKLKEMQQENDALRQEIGAREDELKTMKLSRDQLSLDLETSQQEYHETCSDLEEQIGSLKRDNSALSSKVEKLQQNASILKRKLGDTEEELKTVDLNKNRLTQDIGSVRQEYQKTRTDLKEEIASLKGDNSMMSSKIKHFQTMNSFLKEQLARSEEKVKSMEINKTQLTQDLETVRQEYHKIHTNLEQQNVSRERDKTALSSTIETLQQTVSELKRQLGESEGNQQALHLIKEQLTQNLETVRQEYSKTSTDLKEHIGGLETQLDIGKRNLNTIQTDKEKLANELETIRQEYKITRASLEKQIVSLKGDKIAMSSEVGNLKRNVAMLERQLDADYQRSDSEDGQIVDTIGLHWRNEPIFDKQYLKNLKDEIEHYWPLRNMGVSEEALQQVNILFIGPIGAGKSSFINSVESAFRGYVTLTAGAGSRTRSLTSAYQEYAMSATDNKRTMKFRLCDCRGLEDRASISKDISSILEGHIPNSYRFNTSFPMKPQMYGYKHDPKLEDEIHCVVYVLDATSYSQELGIPFMTDPVKETIKAIQDIVDKKGIPQLVILSKVDTVCELTRHSTSQVYRSPVIRQRCIDAAGFLGVPPMTVLPMKNYFMETSIVDDISILALYNIRQMLRAADSFLRVNHLDQLKEKHA